MTLDAAFEQALAPIVQRAETAAQAAEKAAERITREDTTGIPTDRAAFTVKELSQLLRLDPDTVRELYHSGQLQGRQTGNRILVWRWSVLEFMGLASQEKRPANRKARR